MKEINLLPKEPWETGLLGKLIGWTLQVGRYVVVFTELVVIGAFLFRFGLDRKLSDLRETIKQKQSIVESFAQLEVEFRQLQKRLEVITKVDSESLKIAAVLDELSQITPIDAVYDSINITQQEVNLEGRVFSEAGLATMLAKAQNSQLFSGVSLENITSDFAGSQAITFRMTLAYKNKK